MDYYGHKTLKTVILSVVILLVILLPLLPSLASACAVSSSSYQPNYSEVSQIMQKAAANQMGPDYPAMPNLRTGYPYTGSTVAPSIPGVILKSMAAVESGWKQASGTARGQTGPTLVSSGCGYGVMQITSGMQQYNVGIPAWEQQRIAEEYAYNIAYGAKMLGDKWNYAGGVMGNREPTKAENWYFAVWAYNNRAWVNNPNNPSYPWPRSPYNYRTSLAGNYPYQELVWGYAANPLKDGNGVPLWDPVQLIYPAVHGAPYDDHYWGTHWQDPDWIPDQGAPGFRVTPDTSGFLASPGGPATPPQRISLSDEFGGSYGWSAWASSDGWLSINSSGGSSLPASLTVSVVTVPSVPGAYTGYVTINAGDVPGSPAVLPVSLHVGPIYSNKVPTVMRNYDRGGW